MRKQFSDVSSKYGAPMGRRPSGDAPKGRINLFRVIFDGDYDDGGAYWGGYPSEPLYCARGESADGEGFLRFQRARSRMDAANKLGLRNEQLKKPITERDRY